MKIASLLLGMLGLAVVLVPRGVADSTDAKIVPSADADIAVQTRGPIHEAYAAPVNSSPQPGPVVDKKPPEPIKEVPPDQKPEGENVEWIPGYWAWDSDRNDFTWVSGFWRVPPPDRKWVPGHWSEVDGGWRWAPGFWVPAAQEQMAYIAQAPPDSLDAGPSVPAPNDDSQYIPGNWVYQDDAYAWQPGYWATVQPGYCWTPPRYCWTPRGYCYVSGYWDYPLEDRGLLFAPVCFNRPLWTDPDWFYQPSYCLPFGGLLSSLFCRPSWGCYYFGDYYGAGYYDRGFYPWFAYGRHWHDPLFGYYGWRHRGDPGWYRGLAGDYRARVRGDLARPPRTFAGQTALARRLRNGAINRQTLDALQTVKPLSQIAGNGVHLMKLTPTQREAARHSASAFRQASLNRQLSEQLGRGGAHRPAALSLAHVPSAPTPGSTGFRRESAASAATPRFANPAAATGHRGAPGLAHSTAHSNAAFRNGSTAAPFVNRSNGSSNLGRSAAAVNGARQSAPSFATPRSPPAPPASDHRGASVYRAPATHSQPPNYARQAPLRTAHSDSRPNYHAAPASRPSFHAAPSQPAHHAAPSRPSYHAAPPHGGGGHSGSTGGHSSEHSGGGSGHSSSSHSSGSGGHSAGHSSGGGHGHH